mgnify:FL=1
MYLHSAYFVLELHAFLADVIVTQSHLGEVVMRGEVLSLIGFEGFDS